MTREMGSHGSAIAQEVARRLGYEFLRNDLLRDAAREYRVRESRLVGVVEEAPRFVERFRRPRLRYRTYLEAAVLEAAAKDRVVLVGELFLELEGESAKSLQPFIMLNLRQVLSPLSDAIIVCQLVMFHLVKMPRWRIMRLI